MRSKFFITQNLACLICSTLCWRGVARTVYLHNGALSITSEPDFGRGPASDVGTELGSSLQL
jgi:hypothetical protein